MWLLAKGKHSKAHRNLSRLRGKVSYEKCENEFQEMIRYNSNSNNDEPSNITNFTLHGLFYSILLYSKLNMSSQFYGSQRKYNCLETFFRARSHKTFLFDDDIFLFHEFIVWIIIITILSINTSQIWRTR